MSPLRASAGANGTIGDLRLWPGLRLRKGGYVACCAEVSIGSGRYLRAERVVEAWECGAIVNPEHLKNQVEGAIVLGLGGALFEEIDFADRRILNSPQAARDETFHEEGDAGNYAARFRIT
jgi:hypothetical protein